MANHKSAKKRIRRNEKFQLINKIRKTRVKTFIKKVESFIEKKDKKNAELAFVEAQPEMHRSVTKGVFKKNTISRKLSRLSNKIKFLKWFFFKQSLIIIFYTYCNDSLI